MKYQLLENYFSTKLFQHTVIDYFDTVLAAMIAENTLLQAKGQFAINGAVKKDDYDMPYHIHILNGLMPALLIYEKYLEQKGWLTQDPAKSEIYLKVFMLGFTFHDANKVLQTKQTNTHSDLEIALLEVDKMAVNYAFKDFFTDFDTYIHDICYLALATEYRTRTLAQQYKITLSQIHLREVLAELCHLADANGFASVQSGELEEIELFHAAIEKTLNLLLPKIDMPSMPVSYVKVHSNPYTLLSQQLLQSAKSVLINSGKKVLYAMHNGFVFWGDDITEKEYEAIISRFTETKDIKFLNLVKIDAQKCTFDFLGTVDLSKMHLLTIAQDSTLQHKFLALSPNGADKFSDFDLFADFLKALFKKTSAPINLSDKDGKLNLKFAGELDETDATFRTIYILQKMMWYYVKDNKTWKTDYEKYSQGNGLLPFNLQFGSTENPISLKTYDELRSFVSQKVNTTDALYKVIFCCIKTYIVLIENNDEEEYIEGLVNNITAYFNKTSELDIPNPKTNFASQYLACKGEVASLAWLKSYNPIVKSKKEMCAFTAAPAKTAYTEGVAFGMKARGFSNRTVTALNNNSSFISDLFLEENKLRNTLLQASPKSNIAIYFDFFEASLDIDSGIIEACLKAKNYLQRLDANIIEIEKSVKFQYNLFNLNYEELNTGIEAAFYLVRKLLKMVHAFGIRILVTGIMSPYIPHKAIFYWDNAPKFIQQLGWNSVRMNQIHEVLEEINLLFTFGKGKIVSNLLAVSQNRAAYFKMFYLLNDEAQSKVSKSLSNFILQYPHKFNFMTVTQTLVELAVKIHLGTKSGSEETWIIRTATDYLRRYAKQGASRDDVIQKIAGEIYRTLRIGKTNTDDIEAFATAVYDKLFLEDWKGKLPPKNVEKDWIYQFAFLYNRRSWEIIRELSAKKKENNP